jgi:hypothetical protein
MEVNVPPQVRLERLSQHGGGLRRIHRGMMLKTVLTNEAH